MSERIERVADDERLDEAAIKHFGPDARVPMSKYDLEGRPVIGYLEASDGTYAVVSVTETE